MAFDDFDPAGIDPIDAHESEDDLLDLAREESRAATQSSPTTGADDAALDEDLFGFPVLDGSDQAQSVSAEVSSGSLGVLEEDIERITEQVNELIEDDDLFEEEAPIPASPSTAAAPAPTPAAIEVDDELIAPAPAAPQATPSAAPTAAPAPAPAQAAAPVAMVAPFRLGRAGVLVSAAAVVFAALLLGVVWVTGQGVQEALATRTDAAPGDDALQARIAELESQLVLQREELLGAIQSDRDTEPVGPTVVRVEPEWLIERRLIDAAISEGRYREARKRLFGLQAVMDEQTEDVRAELAPAVAFLIPETYRLQAIARGGDQ